MAYVSTASAPFAIVTPVAGGFIGGSTNTVGNVWAFKSTDSLSTIAGSSFFSDGFSRGMRVGDILFGVDTTNTQLGIGLVTVVSTLSTGGATVAFALSTAY